MTVKNSKRKCGVFEVWAVGTVFFEFTIIVQMFTFVYLQAT